MLKKLLAETVSVSGYDLPWTKRQITFIKKATRMTSERPGGKVHGARSGRARHRTVCPGRVWCPSRSWHVDVFLVAKPEALQTPRSLGCCRAPVTLNHLFGPLFLRTTFNFLLGLVTSSGKMTSKTPRQYGCEKVPQGRQ